MRTNVARLSIGLAILGALAAAPRHARGDTPANDLIKDGVALRRKGNDEGALQLFKQAYELDHGARALAQMGLAEQALGRWAPAHEHVSQALAVTTDAWIAKNGSTLSGALREIDEHVGLLQILGGSPNVEVSIDGVARGKIPLAAPLILPTGPITITLAGPGFVPVQRSTTVRAHRTTRESFEPLATVLVAPPAEHTTPAAERPVPTVLSTAVAPSVPPAPAPAAERVEQVHTVDRAVSPARSSAKWIAWGVAAAAIGVGVTGFELQSSAATEFGDNCEIVPNVGPVPQVGKPATITVKTCTDLRDRQDSRYDLEIAGFVGAAVAASTGLILWLTEPSAGAAQAVSWTCAPAVARGGPISVGCRWRF